MVVPERSDDEAKDVLGWEFSSGYGPHQARIEASRTEVVKQVGEVGGKEGNEEDRLATHV